jgi:hypothetical protein
MTLSVTSTKASEWPPGEGRHPGAPATPRANASGNGTVALNRWQATGGNELAIPVTANTTRCDSYAGSYIHR